jgi:hypothetical protein
MRIRRMTTLLLLVRVRVWTKIVRIRDMTKVVKVRVRVRANLDEDQKSDNTTAAG